MKICLVSDQLSNIQSGIGVHTTNLVNNLTNMGHEVILITNDESGEYAGRHLKIIKVRRPGWDFSHNCWLSLAMWVSREILNLYRQYHFCIFHSLDARQGAIAAKKLKGIVPTIGNMNDSYFATVSSNPYEFIKEYKSDGIPRYLYYHFTRIFEKSYLKNFDVIIANSNITMEGIRSSYNLAPNKIIKMYKALSEIPKKANQIVERKYGRYSILFVGGNLQRKGIFYVLRAAPSVIRNYKHIRFEIIGEINQEVIGLCKKKGIYNNFEFYGRLPPEEVKKHYKKADLFLLPSIIEGFGLTCLEAMSYGLPVIATSTAGIADIIKQDWNGIVIPPKSSEAISESLIRLLGNACLRRKISKNARATAKKFNPKNQAKETLRLYKMMLKKCGN